MQERFYIFKDGECDYELEFAKTDKHPFFHELKISFKQLPGYLSKLNDQEIDKVISSIVCYKKSEIHSMLKNCIETDYDKEEIYSNQCRFEKGQFYTYFAAQFSQDIDIKLNTFNISRFLNDNVFSEGCTLEKIVERYNKTIISGSIRIDGDELCSYNTKDGIFKKFNKDVVRFSSDKKYLEILFPHAMLFGAVDYVGSSRLQSFSHNKDALIDRLVHGILDSQSTYTIDGATWKTNDEPKLFLRYLFKGKESFAGEEYITSNSIEGLELQSCFDDIVGLMDYAGFSPIYSTFSVSTEFGNTIGLDKEYKIVTGWAIFKPRFSDYFSDSEIERILNRAKLNIERYK